MYGGIEAGGTKFVCAVSDEELNITERISFPTTTPEETLSLVVQFFCQYKKDLVSIGVGSFGPIDINLNSATYGHVTSTPKQAWKNFDFLGTLKENFDIPLAWTTDVNAAAYGEYQFGAGQGKNNIVYYTFGTGVGGGAIIGGNFVEGFSHPEMGHMIVTKNKNDQFDGACPYHDNCLEGMASGPAIEKRLGVKGQDLGEDHPYWKIEADYIAQCAYNTTLMLSPDLIIFGGGVMQQEHMLNKVRKAFEKLMNNYVKTPNLEDYIVTPKLGNDAGIIGSIALGNHISLASVKAN